MHIKQTHDRDEQFQWEGVMRRGLVGPIVAVRFRKLVLVMNELSLLFLSEYTKLPVGVRFFLKTSLCISRDFLLRALGQVVVIRELGKTFGFSKVPRQTMVVRDEDHVVGVDCAEGCEAITHYGEKAY